MYEYCELLICIDQQGKKHQVLEKGPIERIDNITSEMESSLELRSYYLDKISIFKEKFGTYMDTLSVKNKRKENGDIALFTTINKEYSRIKVLYKKHIEVFKNVIRNYEFQCYLKNNYYSEYAVIQRYKYAELTLTRESSILIRRIYDIYKEYASKEKKPSPDVLYNKIKNIPKYPENNYQGIYDESKNDPTEPEQLEAYEIEDLEEKGKRYYKSL